MDAATAQRTTAKSGRDGCPSYRASELPELIEPGLRALGFWGAFGALWRPLLGRRLALRFWGSELWARQPGLPAVATSGPMLSLLDISYLRAERVSKAGESCNGNKAPGPTCTCAVLPPPSLFQRLPLSAAVRFAAAGL